ncbi:MAG TPA: YceI family protein [Puia sp.]|jgi:polyisoprenoid-binding protein YceI
MTTKFFLILSLLLSGIFAVNWNVDASAAKVSFAIKGPFGTVHGDFTGLKATIQFDEHDLAASSFTASIDARTVSTGIGLRNKHLRNEEQFLNTDKYPAISFHSKKIEKTANGFTAQGELTLKGTTKPVQIPFTFTPNGNAGVFKGQFTIKRADYNIGKPGGSIGDEITVTLEVPVKK